MMMTTFDRPLAVPRSPRVSTLAAGATLAAALVAASIGGPLAAGTGTWTQIGPYGGGLGSLAIDPVHPAILYGSAGSGVFKSVDHGATWQPVHQGLPQVPLAGPVVVDSQQPATVYFAASNGDFRQLYKSLDAGATWAPIGSSPGSIGALAVDPHDSRTLVYASASPGPPFVEKSVDGGATWSAADAGLPFAVQSLTFDPVAPNTLDAGMAHGGDGIFKTTDGGRTWAALGAPPPPAPVPVLAFDPRSPRTIFASSGAGLFKSVDGGGSWQHLDLGPNTLASYAVAVDPGPTRAVYASYIEPNARPGGVVKSLDGGATWAPVDNGLMNPTSVNILLVDPSGTGRVYAVTDGFNPVGGLFTSVDGGAHWTAPMRAPSVFDLTDFAIDPQDSETLFAATFSDGLRVSHDGGGSWSRVPGLPNLTELTITTDPLAPATLFAAGTNGGSPPLPPYRSSDEGATWTQLAAPQFTATIGVVTVDPGNDRILYGASNPAAVQDPGIVRSADGGATWIAATGGDLPIAYVTVVIDSSAPSNVYAFGGLPNFIHPRLPRLFKSVDRGLTWNRIALSLGLIDHLVVDPNDSAVLYATTGGQLLKSADGGTTWSPPATPADPAGRPSLNLAIAPTKPATVYVGLGRTGLTRSSDGGVTWSPVTTAGLLTSIEELKFDPQDPQHLIASVVDAGLESLTLPATGGPCTTSATALCLAGGRFRVTADWQTAQGAGAGQTLPVTADTGAFWFFAAANLELVVKVLDGCAANGHYWVFAGGLTDVAVTLTVTDSQSGAVRTYTSPNGTPYSPVQDTAAFDTCP